MKSSTASQRRLSAELERAALRAARATYDDLNASFFRRALKPPVFELGDSKERLGCWHREHRTIELGRRLLLEHGWGALIEVLKHEMAHQYVDEVLESSGETAHGPAFRRVCAERGIDACASGLPVVSLASEAPAAHALERVAKLLALAQSSNEHEAQSAMNAAQRLMLKYNIEAVRDGRETSYAFRHLGEPTGRVSEAERLLAVILGDHFFVEPIWVPVWRPLEGKRGSVLEVCGAAHNLELAEYVYAFLMGAAERLWREHKRARRIARNTDRRRFVAGVMAGFRDKLAAQEREQAARGLIWVGDADLQAFFRHRHPHVRWTRHASSRRSEAYSHGRKAGRRIVLHRGVKHGPGPEVRQLRSGR